MGTTQDYPKTTNLLLNTREYKETEIAVTHLTQTIPDKGIDRTQG